MVCGGIVRTGTIYDCHDTQRFLGPEYNAWETSVLATDISRKVLDSAVNGIYSAEQINTLPVWWRNSYFCAAARWNVSGEKELRQQVVFRQFNLMNPLPFKKKCM